MARRRNPKAKQLLLSCGHVVFQDVAFRKLGTFTDLEYCTVCQGMRAVKGTVKPCERQGHTGR